MEEGRGESKRMGGKTPRVTADAEQKGLAQQLSSLVQPFRIIGFPTFPKLLSNGSHRGRGSHFRKRLSEPVTNNPTFVLKPLRLSLGNIQ
jgi:hypothetical protein